MCSGKAYLVDTRHRGPHTPAQLRSLVADLAAKPEHWADEVRFDLTERYFSRLRLTEDHEVWLICWDIGQDTLLHDHGGSVGAFAVARGSLVEDHGTLTSPGLRTRRHTAGDAVAFGPDYVHNLVNVGMTPTVTIHAYAPALTSMNFYCWLPTGLHHLREIPCDTPEPDTSALEVQAAHMRAAVTG